MFSTNQNRYEKQKERAIKRKLEFINLLGGCCQKCGYKKNITALNFHHRNPKEKQREI